MTTIKTTCPSCGDVELTPPQVRLVVCNVADWSYYAFHCSGCSDEIRKPASSDVVSALRGGGVVAEEWKVPAEALEEKTGETVSYDDVLDFALRLQHCDDLVGALAALGPAPAAGTPRKLAS